MGSREKLSSARWKELLIAIREELGEGKVRGYGFHRCLKIPSDAGVGELRLGGGRDDLDGEAYVSSIYLVFYATTALTTDLRVGRASGPLYLDKWLKVQTGNPAFDRSFHTWSKNPDQARRLLSKAVRRAFDSLADEHPGTDLVVYGRNITLNRPGTEVDRSVLLDFVLKAVACVEQLLGRD